MKLIIEIEESRYKASQKALSICGRGDDNIFSNYLINAVAEGIPLEAQPSEDCISREEAINEADNLSLETSYDNEKVEQMLRDLPPVTPERPKGKWIRVVDRAGHWVWECDCKWQQRFATNYCPNCGAYNAEIKESADDDAFSD